MKFSHRKGAKGAKERSKKMKKTREEIEPISEVVVDAMLTVHRALGPGLLESAYQACLAHELRRRGIELACEQIMTGSVVSVRALCALAVNLASDRPRGHHAEGESHRSRRAGSTPIRPRHP
jgi:PD-(D/E)XK nuclease superfamily